MAVLWKIQSAGGVSVCVKRNWMKSIEKMPTIVEIMTFHDVCSVLWWYNDSISIHSKLRTVCFYCFFPPRLVVTHNLPVGSGLFIDFGDMIISHLFENSTPHYHHLAVCFILKRICRCWLCFYDKETMKNVIIKIMCAIISTSGFNRILKIIFKNRPEKTNKSSFGLNCANKWSVIEKLMLSMPQPQSWHNMELIRIQ